MALSVVIPTYNDVEILPETLDPLLRDDSTAEIVVVVDGSRDGSYEFLTEVASRDERVRPFWIQNRGRAGARQYGIERSRREVVLMLDADVVARERLVSGHARHHVSGRDRLVVGYMPPAIPPRRPGSFVLERYAHEYERVCKSYEDDPAQILQRLWLGNVSVTRRALFAAGGCDAGAGVRYCEDVELGLRLAAARVDIEASFHRGLRADHRFEQTVSGFLETSRIVGEDLIKVARRHPGQVSFPVWRKSGAVGAVARYALRPRGHTVARRLGLMALTLAGRLHLWPLEHKIAGLLDRVEVQRGMQSAIRALAGDAAPRTVRGQSG